MIKLNKPYKEYYYLTEDGRIYNAADDTYQQANSEKKFRLKTIENKYKKVSLRILYKQLYNRPYSEDTIENIEGEEWKEIEDTNGCYYISNKGRIKSLNKYEAIILRPYTNQGGYLRVDIKENGKRESKLVHRLVAQYWLEIPKRLDYQLHHKDFDKSNNAADNLVFLSPKEHANIHTKERKNNNGSTKSEKNNNQKRKRQNPQRLP